MSKFYGIFFPLFLTVNLLGQCPPGFNEVVFEINTDQYFSEISWMFSNESGTEVYALGGGLPDSSTHVFSYCLPADACVQLILVDENQDGLYPDGHYKVWVNGQLNYESSVGDAFSEKKITIYCPAGTSCTFPIPLELGTGMTPTNGQTWYAFTPSETGQYVFATCGAVCKTKLWLYDQCEGILLTETIAGALAASSLGCPDGSASLQLFLEAGREYFIRVRLNLPGFPGCEAPIPYQFSYIGPIVGCMDTTACNFDPLATVSGGPCFYAGDPECLLQPDIEIDQNMLRNTVELVYLDSPNICEVEDGCLRAFGGRYVIQFTTRFFNVGNTDYYIGKTPPSPNIPSDQFIWDPCHNHWHYIGYAEYLLYDANGARVSIGTKPGFCVVDLFCPDPALRRYVCSNMGLSPTCADVYIKGIDGCQYIDITDIPPGDYTMVVRLNWTKKPDLLGRYEKTYENNWAQTCFSLTYDGSTPEVTFYNDCPLYTDCAGETFGSTLPDCEGVCGGPAVQGDLNQDMLRNQADQAAYMAAILDGNADTTPCNDLFDDGQVDVYDAAVLQECLLHADEPAYWVQRFPCFFPAGLENTNQLVMLLPGAVDTVAKMFDLAIANPLNRVMGYELSISGLTIAWVENLVVEHQAVPLFNPTNGKIVALATDETSIPKNAFPTAFLRVHYSSLNADEVCISEVKAVVSDRYHKSNAMLGSPNCVKVKTSSAQEPKKQAFAVFVQPNPMRQGKTTIYFENPDGEPTCFSLYDLTGRLVRQTIGLTGESVQVEQSELPVGSYVFRLVKGGGVVVGQIICR